MSGRIDHGKATIRPIDYNGHVPLEEQAVNHDQIVAEIQKRAKARGLLSHYCGSAERCHGDRGMPDLVLAGPFGVAWVEVKTPGDRLRPEQTSWRYMLQAAGEVYEVMGERDLAPGGAVDMLLSFAATGDATAA